MKRIFDIFVAILAAILLAPLTLILALLIKFTSPGPVLYWSDRVGQSNRIFRMPKFRSMAVGTPEVATDLLENPSQHITAIGRFMRRSSLDELPQIWSILKGDMTFVGPRPALYNQDELIMLRKQNGVHTLVPGLTGWAQVNGRDDQSVIDKVEFDVQYLKIRSFKFDLKIICLTIARVASRDGVSH